MLLSAVLPRIGRASYIWEVCRVGPGSWKAGLGKKIVAERPKRCADARRHADLVVDVAEVMAHRVLADSEAVPNVAAVEAA